MRKSALTFDAVRDDEWEALRKAFPSPARVDVPEHSAALNSALFCEWLHRLPAEYWQRRRDLESRIVCEQLCTHGLEEISYDEARHRAADDLAPETNVWGIDTEAWATKHGWRPLPDRAGYWRGCLACRADPLVRTRTWIADIPLVDYRAFHLACETAYAIDALRWMLPVGHAERDRTAECERAYEAAISPPSAAASEDAHVHVG